MTVFTGPILNQAEAPAHGTVTFTPASEGEARRLQNGGVALGGLVFQLRTLDPNLEMPNGVWKIVVEAEGQRAGVPTFTRLAKVLDLRTVDTITWDQVWGDSTEYTPVPPAALKGVSVGGQHLEPGVDGYVDLSGLGGGAADWDTLPDKPPVVAAGATKEAARAAIDAGTSDLALGTTAGSAKAGDWKPTAADVSDATALGRTLMKIADAAAARTALGAGAANGLAQLDGGGKVPSAQLPSYVDDVLEVANAAARPATGEAGKIYITLDNGKLYRWSGSTYVEIVGSPGSTDAVAEGSVNLYFTDARAQTALSAQLSGKAPLASPAFTGTPTAPTAPVGDSTTKVATTEYVITARQQPGSLAGLAPGATAMIVWDSATSQWMHNGAAITARPTTSGTLIFVGGTTKPAWALGSDWLWPTTAVTT